VSAARLRLAAYNIAWFAKLFDRSNMLIEDDEWSALYGVTRRRQAGAIAQVLAHIDADCIAVIEAPNSGRRQSCVAELENFAARFGLRQRAALIGFENPTEQEIALLFDPDRISAEHAPVGEILSKAQARSNGKAGGLPWGVPRFDSIYPADLDGSGRVVLHEFSKPPLEAMVSDRITGLTLRLIAVHLKSKAPHASGPAAKLKRIAHESRAKQYAQAAWLRARLSEHIAAGESVIALGDFNDGPGYDHFEQAVGRSSVELVMGAGLAPALRMVNPVAVEGNGAATARFQGDQTGPPVDALIDFIMLSPELAAATAPEWRMWHPDNDPECAADEKLRAALLEASDHFPVTVDLMLPMGD
jgi:endonuclease/exonuclease/phosphatase family metal-dependent hydrolase